MKILVTGGAGFIGSHVADSYLMAGHNVSIIDNLCSGKKENINPDARFYEMDIRDKETVKLIKSEKYDLINHHAAQMDVRKSVNDPAFDADVNIIGLLNIMQPAVISGVKKIIFSSSGGTIYGECGNVPPDENACVCPNSPYGVSKLSSEYYIKYYSSLYGTAYNVLRYANVYGPRQDPHGEAGVVAIFSDRFFSGKCIHIFGDGRQMRDYVYIDDVVEANLTALKTDDNEIINIGTGRCTSVNELYNEMKESGRFSSKAEYRPARPGELFKSCLDVHKAERILGWRAKKSLAEGLKSTLDYFKPRVCG